MPGSNGRRLSFFPCLAIFAISNQLEAAHGDRIEFFTKSELADYSIFFQPLPDAFISLKTSTQPRARTKHYFLELFEDSTPFFVIARRMRQYSDHVDGGDWELTNKKLPAMLAVCESATLQKRLLKRFRGLDDFKLRTTTKAELPTSDAEDYIWQPTSEPEARLKLSSIS
ncbi:MAG TPA: hypothetical protein VJ836_07550 [Candidatus Saccharimonadales bacterium]|nr:hypothetical protein [Candidatus Saccharimonadales bacterium]